MAFNSSSTSLDPQQPYLSRRITTSVSLSTHSEGHSRRESLSLFDSLVNENESESIDAVALALTSEEIEQLEDCTSAAFPDLNEPSNLKKTGSVDKAPSPFFFANWNTDEDEDEEANTGSSPSFDPDQTIVPGDIRIARLSLSANDAPSKNRSSRPIPPSDLQSTPESMPQPPPSIEDIRKKLARIKNAPLLPGSRRDAAGVSFTPSTPFKPFTPNLGNHELPTPHGKRSLLPTVNLDEETMQVHRVSHPFKYQNENKQLGSVFTRDTDRRMSVPSQAALHGSNEQTSVAASAQTTTSLPDSHIDVDKRTPSTAFQIRKNQMGLLPAQDTHRSYQHKYPVHSQVAQSVQDASVPKTALVPEKKDSSFKTVEGYTSSLPAGKLPAPQMTTKPRSLAPPTSSRVPLTRLKQPDLPSQVSKLNPPTLSHPHTLTSKLPAPSTGLRPPSQILPTQRGSVMRGIPRPADGQGSRK